MSSPNEEPQDLAEQMRQVMKEVEENNLRTLGDIATKLAEAEERKNRQEIDPNDDQS